MRVSVVLVRKQQKKLTKRGQTAPRVCPDKQLVGQKILSRTRDVGCIALARRPRLERRLEVAGRAPGARGKPGPHCYARRLGVNENGLFTPRLHARYNFGRWRTRSCLWANPISLLSWKPLEKPNSAFANALARTHTRWHRSHVVSDAVPPGFVVFGRSSRLRKREYTGSSRTDLGKYVPSCRFCAQCVVFLRLPKQNGRKVERILE